MRFMFLILSSTESSTVKYWSFQRTWEQTVQMGRGLDSGGQHAAWGDRGPETPPMFNSVAPKWKTSLWDQILQQASRSPATGVQFLIPPTAIWLVYMLNLGQKSNVTFYPWRIYFCKTFLEPRKDI